MKFLKLFWYIFNYTIKTSQKYFIFSIVVQFVFNTICLSQTKSPSSVSIDLIRFIEKSQINQIKKNLTPDYFVAEMAFISIEDHLKEQVTRLKTLGAIEHLDIKNEKVEENKASVIIETIHEFPGAYSIIAEPIEWHMKLILKAKKWLITKFEFDLISGWITANRDHLISDLNTIGNYAQQYYRRAKNKGGGGNSFTGWSIPEHLLTTESGTFLITEEHGEDQVSVLGIGQRIGYDYFNRVKVIILIFPFKTSIQVKN